MVVVDGTVEVVVEVVVVDEVVVVVGGGPAGLEAARTAALRGHRVDLYEMTGHLGGQVRMAASAPHRADLEAITRWLASELERLDVHVHLRTPVDPDLIADAAPDEVIIATGSEVQLALKAQELLATKKIAVRVVSMPSTTTFDHQTVAYKTAVLPAKLPRVAVEMARLLEAHA